MTVHDRETGCHECINKDCFVKLCSEKWISHISENKNQIVYARDMYVFREGSWVYGIYFIQTGKIKVVSSGLNGKDQIVRLATDGHILGHRAQGIEKYPISAISLEDSRICFLSNELLIDAFKTNFNFMYRFITFYSSELRKCELRHKYFAQMTVDEKVIYALCYIIETFGFIGDEHKLNALFSRQEIAEIAGTNAEQVSRSISSLKSDGFIATSGKNIMVNDYEHMKRRIASYS